MPIFYSKLVFLSANSVFAIQKGGLYLPQKNEGSLYFNRGQLNYIAKFFSPFPREPINENIK